jgi:hypothetical protein
MQIFLTIIYEINKLLGRPFNPSYENKENIFLDTDSYTDRYITASNLYLNSALIKNIRKVF